MNATHVMLVGIDGLYLPVLLAEPLCGPALSSLAEHGVHVDMSMPAPTLSGPGWATLLTGVTADVHGVRDNSFFGNRLPAHPDLLSRAFYADQSTVTFAAAGWSPLVDARGPGPVIHERREQRLAGLHFVVSREGEVHGFPVSDAQTADHTDFALRQDRAPDVSFVYFGGVDEAGHLFGTEGPQYRRAISRIDTHIARILTRIEDRRQRGERWLVVAVTDHGHLPTGGHGGASDQETASFVLARGIGRDNPRWPDTIEPHHLADLLLAERAPDVPSP